jgi:hypothetical protein
MADQGRCSHAGCTCRVEGPTQAVVQGGAVYCSSGCAAGEGCAPTSCNCGPVEGASKHSD